MLKLDSLALPRVKLQPAAATAATAEAEGDQKTATTTDGKAAEPPAAEVAIDVGDQPADQVDPVWRAKRKAILDEANRLLDAMHSLKSRPPQQPAQTAAQSQGQASAV